LCYHIVWCNAKGVGGREILATYLNSASKNTSETDLLPHGTKCLLTSVICFIHCVRKVAVHLGYGTQIWLSVSKLPLKCAVVSPHSAVKQRLKCNTGKVCNCLIQFLLYRRSWKSLPTPLISANLLSERTV
jgi:hypothetical protein